MLQTDLNGRKAVVTSAGSLTGYVVCEALCRCGAQVVACDQDIENAKKTAETLIKKGYECAAAKLNVTQKEGVYEQADEIIEKFGIPNILVNCEKDTLKLDERKLTHEMDFDRYLDISNREVIGLYYTSKAFMRKMVENGGGVVVNITSMLGLVPKKGCVGNAACAAATMSLSRVWALELCDSNVRVHCIARGDISGEIEEIEQDTAHQATKRMAKADDVANAVLFCASDEAQMENGCILTVDGGLHYGYMRNF